MKKLLFWVGLIVVTTSCSFSNNSGTENSNAISFENDINNNASLFFSGRNGEGVAMFDICYCSFDAATNTLNLEWTFDGEWKKQAFSTSEIADECLKSVKNNKVTLIYDGGKFVPAIIEKDNPQTFADIRTDSRQFTMKSILKGDMSSTIMPYKTMYHIFFYLGFTKAGTKLLKDGQVFFADEDFKPEITSGEVLKNDGQFSAGYCKGYNFMMCQAVCKDNFLIIRMDDGKTFRYPMELFCFEEQRKAVLEGFVSAFQLNNGNWMPAIVGNTYDYFWYSELIQSSRLYNSGTMGKMLDMRKYCQFYRDKGLASIADANSIFFEVGKQ